MTVLSLSNLKVVSENRQYSFSARSGSAHSFSSDFRYVLKKGWRTRWKANQQSGTRPPVELYVSDDGYTVARLHGHRSHPLVARDPFGNELGQVLLSHGENECSATEFSDEYFCRSSAGLFIRGSLGYFFNANGTYFGIHFAWNRRLLMHIETGLLLTGEIDPEIAEAARSTEIETALYCLSRGLRLKPGKRDIRFRGAVGTLLNHQPWESVDIFRILEAEPAQVFAYTSSTTLKGLYYGYLGFRTQAALALRMNGHLPRGYPAIGLFTRGNSKQPLRWPEKLVDRDQRLNSLSLTQSPDRVLNTVGVPDRISRFREGEPDYFDGEHWSYFRGVGDETSEFVLTWEQSPNGVLMREISEVEKPSLFDVSFLYFQS